MAAEYVPHYLPAFQRNPVSEFEDEFVFVVARPVPSGLCAAQSSFEPWLYAIRRTEEFGSMTKIGNGNDTDRKLGIYNFQPSFQRLD